MKIYYQLLQRTLRSTTFLNFVKITIGKVGNGAAAFITNIIIARSLGATVFALFTLSRAVHVITLEIIGSDAVNTGMVRFATQYLDSDKNKAAVYFKIALKYKIILLVTIIFPTLFLVKPFLEHILKRPELTVAVSLGIVGGSCALLQRYTMAVMQSHQRFTAYAIIDIVPNLCKLFLFSLLMVSGLLSLVNSLVINAAAVLFGAIIGFYMIPKYPAPINIPQKEPSLKLFHFSKWIWVANLVYTVTNRADIFLLSYLTTQEQLGFYSAAITFMFGLDLVYMSIMTAFLPKISKLTYRNDYIYHIKKSLTVSIGIASLTIPLFFFAEQIIVITYSQEFIESIIMFKVLLVGFLAVLLIHPLLLVLYARKKTHQVTLIYFLMFLVNLACCLILIPKYDALGAAYAVSISKIFGGVLIGYFVHREVSLCQNCP